MTIYRIAALPAAELVTDPTNPTDPTDPTNPTDPDLFELGDVNHNGDVALLTWLCSSGICSVWKQLPIW